MLHEESTIAERNTILEVYLTIQIYGTLRVRRCITTYGKFVFIARTLVIDVSFVLNGPAVRETWTSLSIRPSRSTSVAHARDIHRFSRSQRRHYS